MEGNPNRALTDGERRLLQIIYGPPEIGAYTREIIEHRIESRALRLKTGIASVDAILQPALPGDLIVILASRSSYKSGWMSFWANQVAQQIVARPDYSREFAMVCTWEMQIEELACYDLAARAGLDAADVWYGDIDETGLEALRTAAFERGAYPLWMIGPSLKRRRRVSALTLPMVRDALLLMEDVYEIKPAIIYLDYLQVIDPVQGEERRMQVMYNVDRSKQLGRDLGCPVVLGCQAGRQVDERGFKLPTLSDGQETSRIEQVADKVIALWYPKTTEALGDEIKELGLKVTDNLLVFGLRKQRMGEAGQVLPLYVDPARNYIAPMETRQEAETPQEEEKTPWWQE